jgi:hypothetical protein
MKWMVENRARRLQRLLDCPQASIPGTGQVGCVLPDWRQWRGLGAGVYFLIQAGSVQYVGQSRDVQTRIKGQRRKRPFETAMFIPCEEHELRRLEAYWIDTLRPPGNKSLALL